MGLKIYSATVVLFFVCVTLPTIAQEEKDIRFRTLSIQHGLSQSSVNALIEDRQGTLWLATQDGLNRYNGIDFTVFNFDQADSLSISNGHIRALLECKDGLIWVGTEGGGLNSYNKHSGEFTRYLQDKNDPTTLSSNHIRCLAQTADGAIWIGTTGGGLNRLDKKTGKFKRYEGKLIDDVDISRLRIEALYPDNQGNIWIGTSKNGLIRFNYEKETWEEGFLPNNLESQRVSAILPHEKNTIWIGTYGGGLYLLNTINLSVVKHYKSTDGKHHIPNDYVVSLLKDDDQLWIGTYGGGLAILNIATDGIIHRQHQKEVGFSLSNNDVWSLCKTREGVIFVGTDGGGLSIYDKNAQKFKLYRNTSQGSALSNNMVRCIFEDSRSIWWIGTYGGGLSAYNPATKQYTSYRNHPEDPNSISTDRVVSIVETPDGLLWFGTDGGGLNRYDPKTGRFFVYQNRENDSKSLSNDVIWCMEVEGNDGLWLGTRGGGLNYFDRRTETFTVYRNNPIDNTTIGSDFIRCVVNDKEGYLWVGTEGGGFCRFDKKTGEALNYKNSIKNPNTLNNNTARTIFVENPSRVWIGTDGGGLNLLDFKRQEFHHFTDKDGLPNNVIYGILPDGEGNLWMSTNKGLCRFRLNGKPQERNFTVKNYDISDGLQNNEFNTGAYFKNAKGQMFFGGINGFNRFNPAEISENTFVPPIMLTSFKVFERKYQLDTLIEFKKHITLHYTENFFSFGFSALSFSMPEKNQYAYMMEGFDNDWIEVTNRNYASYTNLNPGEYVFRVKASNNDGIWNQEGIAIRLTITPPFYKTNWFYALCVTGIFIAGFTYIKLRERKLKAEKFLLEKTVRARTAEILEKNVELNKQKQEITDSINYAKRIQQAILPLKEEVQKEFVDSFIFYLPKDIVSGDFYWYKNTHDSLMLGVVDCTGHGVPGALMSMIGLDKLNDISSRTSNPGEVIYQLNNAIKSSLRQASFDVLEDNFSTNDGMDMALVKISKGEPTVLEYSGANRPLWVYRKTGSVYQLEEILPTKESVGGITEENTRFESHTVSLSKGDTFYMFSDGYADQFGGDGSRKGKKFMTKNLKILLESVQHLSMVAQAQEIEATFNRWKGDFEQVDDVCVIGVRL